MKSFKTNKRNIDLIKKIKDLPEYKEDFREIIFQSCKKNHGNNCRLLDLGRSSRNYSNKFEELSSLYITADINSYEGIDLVFDLCDEKTIPAELQGKFNNIIALAMFEHLWQPFKAADNLTKLIDKKDNPKIWIYAPFLFSFHSPESLEYQDYFRYTRDSWAVLFPEAKQITVSPVRGRFTTALNLAVPRYKLLFEKKFNYVGKFFRMFDFLYSKHSNKYQVSGSNVLIEY